MLFPRLRKLVPRRLAVPLWGDREKWGLKIQEDDPCWKEWQAKHSEFYTANQREGVGKIVNDAGYKIMKHIDLSGKKVLEIGPGDIRHITFWNGQPLEYTLVDIRKDMLFRSTAKLSERGIEARPISQRRGDSLPIDEESIDVVVSFYSLEHIYPIAPYLKEIKRVLKKNGVLIGAIPAEGGLAWGAGRLVTSRRWLKKNTNVDPDKIICWEHANFGDEIIKTIEKHFRRQNVSFWPFSFLPFLDLNLVIRFIYRKT